METVAQIAEEVEIDACIIHEVTNGELDNFLRYLKLVARQTDRVISVEIEKDGEVSHTLTFNPRSSKRKISLHYGEVYLLARAISHPDIILCDDESVIYLNSILTGICGTNLTILRTIEYLYLMFRERKISATDFKEYFKKMGDLGLLYFKYPPKDAKDVAISDILLDFMDKTSSAYNNLGIRF